MHTTLIWHYFHTVLYCLSYIFLNLVREFILHNIHLGLMCNSVLVVSLCIKLFYMLDILGTFYSVYVFS